MYIGTYVNIIVVSNKSRRWSDYCEYIINSFINIIGGFIHYFAINNNSSYFFFSLM